MGDDEEEEESRGSHRYMSPKVGAMTSMTYAQTRRMRGRPHQINNFPSGNAERIPKNPCLKEMLAAIIVWGVKCNCILTYLEYWHYLWADWDLTPYLPINLQRKTGDTTTTHWINGWWSQASMPITSQLERRKNKNPSITYKANIRKTIFP